MKDLHRADAHLIEAVSDQKDCKPSEGLAEDEGEGTEQNDEGLDRTVSVVLMVVQSVRDRYTSESWMHKVVARGAGSYTPSPKSEKLKLQGVKGGRKNSINFS